MPQFISVEISGEEIANAMAEDGVFALEVWETLAERIDMGAMRDDAWDIASKCTRARAKYLSNQFQSLADAFAFGAANRP